MILRDKSKITEMLILLEILKGKRKLREIAEEVNITVQGVSEYMKTLEKEGYVKDGKITHSGWDFLNACIEELGEFVHEANSIMEKRKVVEAIAGEDIEKGESVGLFLENGYLYAYRRSSSSTGIALTSAKRGEDIGVGNLRGILDIDFGKVEIFVMPSVEEGGSRAVNREKVEKLIQQAEGKKIGVCGVVAYITLHNLGRIDFEFSSANSAVEAAYRGISTLLFVSHEMLPYVVKIMADKGVKYRVRDIRDL